MADKEKLKAALYALKYIGDGRELSPAEYAAKVYAKLTAPRMETAKIKQRICPVCKTIYDGGNVCPCETVQLVDCTVEYSLPIEEKEEVWEGKIKYAETVEGDFPSKFLYETVEVRRLKGE